MTPSSTADDDTEPSVTFAPAQVIAAPRSVASDEKSEGRTSKQGSLKGSQKMATQKSQISPGIKIKNSSSKGHSGTEKAPGSDQTVVVKPNTVDSRSGKNSGAGGQPVEPNTHTSSQTAMNIPVDIGMDLGAHILPPDLSLLWKFSCHITKVFTIILNILVYLIFNLAYDECSFYLSYSSYFS